MLIFILGCFLTPNLYIWGNNDRNCWITWSNYINHFGIQNVYKLRVDYPPLWHYFLWLFGKANPTPEGIYLKVYNLKYLVFFIETLSVFVVYRVLLANKIKYATLLPLLILGNIAFWYNNFLFGQMDGVHTAFAFIAIVLATFRKPMLSLVFLVLCINFKFQGVIFLPIIALLIFDEVKNYPNRKKVFTIMPAILLQLLIFLPFILIGDMKLAFNSFSESMGRYPFVSMGAYNVWSLIFTHPETMNDNSGIFNFSFNTIGLLSFFGLSGLVLLPFGLKSLGIFYKKIQLEFSFENVLLATTLIILVFFYFNTQMHARYSHPVVLFAGTLAILRKDYLRYLLVSMAVFLNMEGASKILKGNIAEFESFWFQPWFVSLLFLVVIALYFYDFLVLIFKSMKVS